MELHQAKPRRLLRKPAVEDRVGLVERAWRPLEDKGLFPKRVLLNPAGGRAVGWFENEIEDYLAKLAASRVAA